MLASCSLYLRYTGLELTVFLPPSKAVITGVCHTWLENFSRFYLNEAFYVWCGLIGSVGATLSVGQLLSRQCCC